MNSKIPILMKYSVAILIIFSTQISAQCVAKYEEINGKVIIETENMGATGQWQKQTKESGYTGTGYINWTGADSFTNTSNGVITVKIKINATGTYKFQWRSKVGEGTSPTDFNDSWLKFPDADSFYGLKGTKKIYPTGSGLTPNPEGAGANGFFKVYSTGTTAWTWTSKVSDRDPHDVYVQFDKPGVYTMLVAARSKNHLLDRITLSKSGDATSLDLTETLCGGTNPVGCQNVILEAINNFTNINVTGFSPAYKDNARNALAIDASQYKDKFAAANTTFKGENGNYNITIKTLTELDGESNYVVKVAGKTVGTFKNPTTTTDYVPAKKTFNNIAVKNGDLIQVEFDSNTNGKVPENGGTAFSRGRWTSLDLECISSLSVNDNYQLKSVTIAPNPSDDGLFSLNEVLAYRVYDMTGKEVISSKSDIVNLSSYSEGIYLLKVVGYKPTRLVVR
jgi:hypothetical protein